MFRILTTAITRNQLLLALGDVVCIALALFTANLVYKAHELGPRLYFHIVYLAVPSLFIIGVHMFFFYLVDLYKLNQDMLSVRYFAGLVLAVGLSLFFLGICFFLFPSMRYGRVVTLLHVVFLIAFVMGWRYVFVKFIRGAGVGVPVLLVGVERCTRDIAKALMEDGQTSYHLVGLIQANGADNGEKIEGVPVLGGPDDLPRLVREQNVQEIVLAAPAEKNGPLVKTLIRLGYQGVPVSDSVSFYERLTGRIPFDHLTDSWLLSHSMGNVRFFQWRIKRLADIVFSIVGLVVGAIPLALAMLAIRLTSPGPIFYRQQRLGRNGVPFILTKLRTMVPNAEQDTGPIYTSENDPRITPVGRFLRRTRLDELPQLWNVLKGEMSLVGPRPERPEFVEKFDKLIPYYAERLAVRPGITGWAQVKCPYASTLEETKLKLQYDLYYIKNMSLVLDFLILIMTIKTILFARGR